MPCCVLRVDGAEFNPDAFLASTGFVADTIYRRGEPRRGDAIHTTSGFTVLVSDVGDYGQQVQDAVRYLRDHRDALAQLRDQAGVGVTLDFGCELPVEK